MISLHSDLETTGIIKKWVPDDCAECKNDDKYFVANICPAVLVSR